MVAYSIYHAKTQSLVVSEKLKNGQKSEQSDASVVTRTTLSILAKKFPHFGMRQQVVQ